MDQVHEVAQLDTGLITEAAARPHGQVKEISVTKNQESFQVPFGYDFDGEDIVINPVEAEVVSEIFQLYSYGSKIPDIIKWLSSLDTPIKINCTWSETQIKSILSNPIYCGYYPRRKFSSFAKYEPIIEISLFIQVQNLKSR
jgi:hypothetical protein